MKKDADDMTTQEILTAIRTEIERLKRQLIRGACAAQVSFETSCKDEAYNEILSFLGTLEGNSEKPNNHLEHVPEIKETGTRDLDEAAERFIQDKVDAAGHPGWDWETRDVFDGFKAGAEWSLSQFEKVALSDDLYMKK